VCGRIAGARILGILSTKTVGITVIPCFTGSGLIGFTITVVVHSVATHFVGDFTTGAAGVEHVLVGQAVTVVVNSITHFGIVIFDSGQTFTQAFSKLAICSANLHSSMTDACI
jgi:hypothetical protein